MTCDTALEILQNLLTDDSDAGAESELKNDNDRVEVHKNTLPTERDSKGNVTFSGEWRYRSISYWLKFRVSSTALRCTPCHNLGRGMGKGSRCNQGEAGKTVNLSWRQENNQCPEQGSCTGNPKRRTIQKSETEQGQNHGMQKVQMTWQKQEIKNKRNSEKLRINKNNRLNTDTDWTGKIIKQKVKRWQFNRAWYIGCILSSIGYWLELRYVRLITFRN